MGFEVGPPRYTQQQLDHMQKQSEENQRQSSGAESAILGFFIFCGIAAGLFFAFPTFFGTIFSIIGWAISLSIWGAILYAAYRIYRFFMNIRAAKEQEEKNAFPTLIDPDETGKS